MSFRLKSTGEKPDKSKITHFLIFMALHSSANVVLGGFTELDKIPTSAEIFQYLKNVCRGKILQVHGKKEE